MMNSSRTSAHPDERKVGIKWKGPQARRACIEAFKEEHTLPAWVSRVTALPPPHNADNALFSVVCVGRQFDIKILPSIQAMRNFWECYPEANVVVVIINPNDHGMDIRRKVFSQVEMCL
jgi:hypothetical protein